MEKVNNAYSAFEGLDWWEINSRIWVVLH